MTPRSASDDVAPAENIPLSLVPPTMTDESARDDGDFGDGTVSTMTGDDDRELNENEDDGAKQSRGAELHAHFDALPGHPREPSPKVPVVDIEHVPVDDDPREWSNRKKASEALGCRQPGGSC